MMCRVFCYAHHLPFLAKRSSPFFAKDRPLIVPEYTPLFGKTPLAGFSAGRRALGCCPLESTTAIRSAGNGLLKSDMTIRSAGNDLPKSDMTIRNAGSDLLKSAVVKIRAF
jgi:hypothetical protein